MKMMVRLAVLMATLLLLAGTAFSRVPCYFYEYDYTNLDDPLSDSGTSCAILCFNYGDPSGTYSNLCENGDLVLFFDSMNKQALLYSTGIYPEVGYLKFHGDWLHVFTGILYCEGEGNDRYIVRGHKVESCPGGSDITWKQNIEPLSSSLEKVMLLQGLSYDWKVDEYPEKGFTNTRQIGFIAQDVEKVFPELVRTDTNGYKSIYYAQMVAVLLEAMKEQQKEISDLRKQQEMIAALTEKISQLEKALEQKGSNLSASVQ